MEPDGRLNPTEERALLVMREAPDLAGCLDALETLLSQYFDVDGYAINLHQPSDNTLHCVRVHMPANLAGIEEAYAHTAIPLNGEHVSSRVFASGIPLGITASNAHEFPTVTRQTFESLNMKHMVILPIQVTGTTRRPIGVLMLFSQRGSVHPLTLRRITRVVEEAAALLRLHQSITSWEARASSIHDLEKQMQSLLRFVAEMSNLTAEGDVYPRILHEFLDRFELDIAAILLVEDDRLCCVDTLLLSEDPAWQERWRAHCRKLCYSMELGDGASSIAYVYNQHLFFGDIPSILGLAMSDKDRANLTLLGSLQSFAIFPIRKQGKPVGLLWLGSLQRKNALSTEQLGFVQHLCDFLGGVVENARAYTLIENQRQPSAG